MTVLADSPDVTFGSMSVERLEARMVELSSQIAGATCELLLLIGAYDAIEGWRAWGVGSASAWLSWQCGLGRTAAREHVRVARALREFPQLVEPFRSGRLSYSKVRAITRDLTEATVEVMLDWAINAPAAQIERICSGRRRNLRSNELCSLQVSRYLTYRWDSDGSLVGSFRLPTAEGVVVVAALAAARDVLPEMPEEVAETEIEAAQPHLTDSEGLPADGNESDRLLAVSQEAPNYRREQRSTADALVEMAERALAAIASRADPDDDGAGLPGLGAERFTLVMHTSASAEATNRTSGDGPDLFAEVMLGSGVIGFADDVTRRLSCDCSYAEQTDDADGNPLHRGRKTRRIRGRLARAVHARDGGMCQAPGCGNRTKQIHHIAHWANGGPTCIENLISLCDRHHWLVHEGGWRITGPQGHWRFHSPDGKTLGQNPPKPPTVVPMPSNPTIAADATVAAWGPQPFSRDIAVGVLTQRDRLASLKNEN
jgi:hypothetical protein